MQVSSTNSMQRVSESELVVFCGAAARLRRAASALWALAAAQKESLYWERV
jgi:hypothetical protein